MRRERRGGFTLLEVTIVVLIISLIIGASFTGMGVVDATMKVQTEKKLDQIEKSLMAFRIANNRLPCPADALQLPTASGLANASYGIESSTPGTCTGGTVQANYVDTTNNIVEGAVPFKALGLPEEFMYDAWGSRFVYAVNMRVTGLQSMLGQSLNESCGITVNDASGNSRTQPSPWGAGTYPPAQGMYVLMSYGPNGHGGFIKGNVYSTDTALRDSSGSTDADELTNCHCDSTAAPLTPSATAFTAAYVQKSPNTTFDDIVRFKDRWQMMTPGDSASKGGPACQKGFRIDGDTAGYYLGTTGVVVGDVNGDGLPDMIIGDSYGGSAKVVVIFGTRNGFPNPLPLTALDGTNGFAITGGVYLGIEALAVGDLNGDGYADMIMNYGTNSAGYTFVVFGGPRRQDGKAWAAAQTVTSLANGTNGFKIYNAGLAIGPPKEYLTGDINGDKSDDLVMITNSGLTYVILGHTGAWPATVDPTVLSASAVLPDPQGFTINRNCNACATGALGDLNGDGKADIALSDSGSAPGRSDGRGVIAVIYGSASPFGNFDLTTTPLNGTNGIYFYSATGSKFTLGGNGYPLLGDVNGDGIPDLLIGTPTAGYVSGAGSNAGVVFVVFGPGPNVQNSDIDALVTSGAAVRIDGPSGGSYGFPTGMAVTDVNGDGFGDILMDAEGRTTPGLYGSVYMLFGHGGKWSTRSLYTTQPTGGSDGVRFDCSYAVDSGNCGSTGGIPGLWHTSSSTTSTDINGDGIGDLFIPIKSGNPSGLSGAGYVYTVFGSKGYGANAWPAVFPLSTIK